MAYAQDDRSLSQLISDLTHELSSLFRKESQLIRAEMGEKLNEMARGVVSIAAGAIFLLISALFLLHALSVWIAAYTGQGWASLIVGIGTAAVGLILLAVGRKNARPENLTPERSVRQAQKDISLVKDQVR